MIISFKGNGGGGGGYVLPPATTTTLGGVKVGSGLTIDSGGTLSTGIKEIHFIENNTGSTEQASIYAELKSAITNDNFDPSKYRFLTIFAKNSSVKTEQEIICYTWEGGETGRIFFNFVTTESNSNPHNVKLYSKQWALYNDGKFKDFGSETPNLQYKLTAGEGIEITTANTINCTAGGASTVTATSLNEITNPVKDMTVIIPGGTPTAMKGFNWSFEAGTSPDYQFTVIDKGRNINIGTFHIAKSSSRIDNSSEGLHDYWFSERAGELAFYFYDSTRKLYMETNKWNAESSDSWTFKLMFEKDYFDTLEFANVSEGLDMTTAEENIIIDDINSDREYVYVDEVLYEDDLLGFTIDVSQVNTGSTHNDFVCMEGYNSNNEKKADIRLFYNYNDNGINYFYIHDTNNSRKIVFHNDNKWYQLNDHVTTWIRQSGTTLDVCFQVKTPSWYDVDSVSYAYSNDGAVTTTGTTHIKVEQKWQAKNREIIFNKNHVWVFRDYDLTLDIYKALSLFDGTYVVNPQMSSNAIKDFVGNADSVFLFTTAQKATSMSGYLSDKKDLKWNFEYDTDHVIPFEGWKFTYSSGNLTEPVYTSIFARPVWIDSANTFIAQDVQPDANGVYDYTLSYVGKAACKNERELTDFINFSPIKYFTGEGQANVYPMWYNPQMKIEEANQTYGDYYCNRKVTLTYSEYIISFYCNYDNDWIADVTVTPRT